VSDVVIEKGVPMPPPVAKRGFMGVAREMEVGDSFVIPMSVASARNFAGNCNRVLGPKRFVSRKVDDGLRIWRVS